MAPKKFVFSKPVDERDLTEEEIEQLNQLMQMMALEDAQSQVASSSNETLNGYIPIVERKLHEYMVAFNTVKGEVVKREKERKIEEKKVKAMAERELKKEENKTMAGKPITINIRYALTGNGFPITVPQNTTIGEFRRIILAHVNSMNPSGGVGLGKARKMVLMLNEEDVSLAPRKTLRVAGLCNGCTITALFGGSDAVASHDADRDEEDDDEDDEEDYEEEVDEA